jgi:hypothetical protein
MLRVRRFIALWAVLLSFFIAASSVATPAAAAPERAGPNTNINAVPTNVQGATLDVERFVVVDGALYAIGAVRGLTGVEKAPVVITPVTYIGSTPPPDPDAISTQQVGPNEPGVCDVLFLHLPPIFLDLLGLTIETSLIQIDVDAVPGPGNLLGNLLCAILGLLDPSQPGSLPTTVTLLTQIADLLNRVLAILG